MTARQVHSVIAAGLDDPTLVARWEGDPERLRREGIDPASIDLDALRKFAGLTIKVRHNGLRDELPRTFRLLNVAGIEIEVFSAYAEVRQGELAATTEARTRDLLAFLDGWLDRSRREHVMLWDLIRHEHAVGQMTKVGCLGAEVAGLLTKAGSLVAGVSESRGTPSLPSNAATEHPSNSDSTPSLPGNAATENPNYTSGTPSLPSNPATEKPSNPLTLSSIPHLRGAILLHEMQCDPREVIEALRQSRPPLDGIAFDTRYLCYWRAEEAREIRIVELDAFGFYALSLVDGTRSAADLSEAMGGKRRPSRPFLRLLGQLGEAGIVRFERP